MAQELKKKKIKVLLSGEGADEFFAGYDRIYRWAKYTNSFSVKKFCEYYCYNKINSVNLKKIESYCEKFLGNFKKPQKYVILKKLPKGPSGKILKLELKKMINEKNQI